MLYNSKNQSFFLMKDERGEGSEYGAWEFIGGRVDQGEELVVSLEREIREEAGDIEYTVNDVVSLMSMQSIEGEKMLLMAYLVSYISGDVTLSDEHSDSRWATAEEIEKSDEYKPWLKQLVAVASKRLKEREYLTDLQRLQADFSNYRRRQEESQKELRGFLVEKFLVDLLPVMDNFRMATGHVPEEQKASPWVTGIGYIEQQLEKVLKENGVTTLAVSVGDKFDPSIHEAVSQASGAGSMEHEAHDNKQGEEGSEGVRENESGTAQQQTVAQVLQNGYKIGDRVVRPAKVVVG